MRIALLVFSVLIVACAPAQALPASGPTSTLATVPATPPATTTNNQPRPALRVMYVFDVGGLADVDADALKDEIRRAILSLRVPQRVQLIACADGVQFVFPPDEKRELMTPESKRDALEWLDVAVLKAREKPSGPDATAAITSAVRSALAALGANPRPRAQVLYVLTPRTLAPSVATQISEANRAARVSIHAIAYLHPDRAGVEVLRKIAADSRGIFKYVKTKDLIE